MCAILTVVSELLANNHSIVCSPPIITHCPPCVVVAHLYPALTDGWASTHQTYISSGTAWYVCWMCWLHIGNFAFMFIANHPMQKCPSRCTTMFLVNYFLCIRHAIVISTTKNTTLANFTFPISAKCNVHVYFMYCYSKPVENRSACRWHYVQLNILNIL